MALDTGLHTDLVMPFSLRPPLLVLPILEPPWRGCRAPEKKPFPLQSYRSALTFSPQDHPHPSAQRLGLGPLPVSRAPAQCWLQMGHLLRLSRARWRQAPSSSA